MADSKVSSLTASGALTGTEVFYADNGSADVKVTANQIKTFAQTASLTAADKQIVYNDGGALAGTSLMTFDKTTGMFNLGNGLGGVNRVTAELVRASHRFSNPTNPPNPTYHQVILQDNLANFSYTADTTFINKAIMVIAGVDGTNTANWTRTAYPCLVAVEGQAGSQPGSTGTINLVAALSGIIFNSGGATIDQAVGVWVDPSGSGFNYYVGVKATGFDHGTNNTGIYLGIDQSVSPATGNWGFYDCTGYKSHFGGDVEIVGAVTSGAWNGTKVGLAYGGTNADLSATGGASQVLRQSTLGGAVTVSALTSADVGLGNVTNNAQANAANYPNAAQGQLEVNIAVDFHSNANTDFAVTIALPTGYTRWRFVNGFLNNASASLSGGTCGVFSGAGGTGTALVASGTSATLAVTTENTANNMQSLTPANSATATSYTYTTIFFRVQNVSSVAATCNFTLQYCPIS